MNQPTDEPVGEQATENAKTVLPDANSLSEWFADDQRERLERCFKGSSVYDKYSVYERYSESKGPL